MRRTIFTAEHDDFREAVRSFVVKEAAPSVPDWEEAGIVPRSFWKQAAAQGLVGFAAAERYGGAGVDDFRFNAVLDEEIAYAGAMGDNFSLQNDIICPYLVGLTTEEQRDRWLHPFTRGDLIASLAMSEPGAGSDLRAIATTARPDGEGWLLNGSKTFVTSGIQCDVVIVVARAVGSTAGLNLLVVEDGADGFTRGRKLKKVGHHAQDTAELFFDDVYVPATNLLGEPGRGLDHLKANLPQERLSVAVTAIATAETALELTLDHCRNRRTFGRALSQHQSVRFALADMHTEIGVGRAYVDRCIEAHVGGELTPTEAASAKLWSTELEFRVVDRCLQLHGGYGYMEEYPIARIWRDSRVQRIYAGANEIMRDIVGRGLEG